MNKHETRVARLEEAAPQSAKPCVFVFVRSGEGVDECIRRAGHEPGDPNKRFVVVQWVARA